MAFMKGVMAFMVLACVSVQAFEEDWMDIGMPEMPSGDWAAADAETLSGDCPMCAMGLDEWYFTTAGAAFAPDEINYITATSKFEVGAETQLTFDNDANTFGGKGLEVKGEANFKKGVTTFPGPLNSTGFVDMAAETTLEIMKNEKPSVIAGTGMHSKGTVDINKDAELVFDGPLALDVGGLLNISTGALVGFSEVPADKIHYIGGEGMKAEGQVDINDGADVAFAGPCKVDGAGKVNITKLGKVKFGRLAEGKKHMIGGAGMENKGNISIKPGVVMDAPAPVKNSGQMAVGNVYKATTSRRLTEAVPDAMLNVYDFECQAGGQMNLNEGGMLVATAVTGTDPLPLIFNGATLSGDGGTLKGTVKMTSSAKLTPNDANAPHSAGMGQLNIQGDLEMDATCVTEQTVMMGNADTVEISGAAKLAGTVKVDIKWRPAEDTSYPLIIAQGGVTGTYSACDGCGAGDSITYDETSRRLGEGEDTDRPEMTVTMHVKGAGTTEGPRHASYGDKHLYGGTGMSVAGENLHTKPDSFVEIGTTTELHFNNEKNIFGGKGLENKGELDFHAGDTFFTGPLDSSGFMNISESAQLHFPFLPDSPEGCEVGGEGMYSEGDLDIEPKSKLFFTGPLSLEGGGFLNISIGSLVGFGELPEGKVHTIGGEGMDSLGRVDISPGAEIDFAGPCNIEGAGLLNITNGGKVQFDPLPDGGKHMIGGEGMENEGAIFVKPGVTMDATAPIKNSGQMTIGNQYVASTWKGKGEGKGKGKGRRLGSRAAPPDATMNVYDFECQAGGQMNLNEGGMLVATAVTGTDPLPLIFNGATLSGDGGTLKGTVKMAEKAKLSPGDANDPASDGNSKLTITGNLEMDTTTVTELTLLRPGKNDHVEISGTAKVAGEMKLDIKWRPEEDTTYPLMSAANMVGTFSCSGCGAEDTIDIVTTTSSSRRLASYTPTSGPIMTAFVTVKGDGGTGAPKSTTYGHASTGETHMYGGTGPTAIATASDNSKPESFVDIGSHCEITYSGDGNVFGGKGFENKGDASFASGHTTFSGKLDSTGQMNVDYGASLYFTRPEATSSDEHQEPFYIGGTGMKAEGDIDIDEHAELLFAGPFHLDGAGFMNISFGGLVGFGELPVGQSHHIGGEGMESSGRVDFRPGAMIDFEGPCNFEGDGAFMNISGSSMVFMQALDDGQQHHIGGEGMTSEGLLTILPGSDLGFYGPCNFEGDGMLNITNGGQVEFDPLPAGEKHMIGGKGIENEGTIFVKPGVTMDATAPIKNSGKMTVGNVYKASTSRRLEGEEIPTSYMNVYQFECEPGGVMNVNEGGSLVATAATVGTDPLPLIFDGGTLSGDEGVVQGTVKMTASAQLSPGDPNDPTSAGTGKLTITGTLETDATTTTKFSVKNLNADQVVVSGTAKIAGTVDVDVKTRPEKDTTYQLLTATGGITGTYSSCNGCGADDEISYVNSRRRLGGDTTTTVSLKVKGSGVPVTDSTSSSTDSDSSTTASSTTDADAGTGAVPIAAIAGGVAGVVFIGAAVAMFVMAKKKTTAGDAAVKDISTDDVNGEKMVL
jgi:hypothetical protein